MVASIEEIALKNSGGKVPRFKQKNGKQMILDCDPIQKKIYVQLPLFPETPAEKHEREIAELRRSCDKLRKSLYARNSDLAKGYHELKTELEWLKESICKYQKINTNQGSFL